MDSEVRFSSSFYYFLRLFQKQDSRRGEVVSWAAQRQKSTAQSPIEAGPTVASEGAKEAA